MVKYKRQFQLMIDENKLLFSEFKKYHDLLDSGDGSVREEFNEIGRKVQRVVRRYENELCAKSENSGFGRYSENLSEKFWFEVRQYLPKIDKIEIE